MNSITLINKVELQLYSTLINVMSGINNLKSTAQHYIQLPFRRTVGSTDAIPAYGQSPDRSFSIHWEVIQQALLSLLLWTILGFAAGFLIGMIKPR